MTKQTRRQAAAFIASILADKDPRGAPDCYMVFRTTRRSNGPGSAVVGGPIVVYKTGAALRRNFSEIVARVNGRHGLDVLVWWYDDNDPLPEDL